MLEQQTGVYENPYKFNAKELDSETGLYYYGARYYNPRISTWYGVDPLAEATPSFSPDAYALQNPVSYIDPTGMIAEDRGKAIWQLIKNFFGFGSNKRDAKITTVLPGADIRRAPTVTVGELQSLGKVTQAYRDYEPSPTDLDGQVIKPIMNGLFDAGNLIRNVVFDKKIIAA